MQAFSYYVSRVATQKIIKGGVTMSGYGYGNWSFIVFLILILLLFGQGFYGYNVEK
ncbi:hypothetical protein JCM39194_01880 [Desulfotomaculum varum]